MARHEDGICYFEDECGLEVRNVSSRKRLPEVRSVSSFLLFILMPFSLSFLSGLTIDRCGAPDVIPVAPCDIMSVVVISFGVWRL